MKELLALLPHPSSYLGTEEGSCHKPLTTGCLHVALAFPDMYEIGMSYLGHKILYNILNARENRKAERVYTPSPEAMDILRSHHAKLATLESDTDLDRVHLVGFSVTHELCYTNMLAMLDLAGIPLRTEERAKADSLTAYPIIAAGGGCTLSAEPIAPFMDVFLLGDGENLLQEFCDVLAEARETGLSRREFLIRAAAIPGVYVPELYQPPTTGAGPLTPVVPNIPKRPARRIVADIDQVPYPTTQVIPFGAVHNRLSLEIARGCTRGCRFCQAGMLYRPSRERSLPNLKNTLQACLASTGFDEVSFLALSAGDFSALRTLFLSTADHCAAEQISLSLPSLRVGSIDDAIMRRMADIRRTGATLAPEAGSQRLRDIINKGVTEEDLLLHVRKLFQYGWQTVKLYFMIGLPGETDDDLHAITDLCRKVRDAAGKGMPRLQVTAAISPFVPKPHTPFQWEPQIPMEEIHRRIHLVLEEFRHEKSLNLRWHEPAISRLEGLFSRGDRRLANVIERAYRKGAVFPEWKEHFTQIPWDEALTECGLTYEEYTRGRSPDEWLPWSHLEPGVSEAFLKRERKRAFEGKITKDCRYSTCNTCGACDTTSGLSLMARDAHGPNHANRLIFPQRDQQSCSPEYDADGRLTVPLRQAKKTSPPIIGSELGVKAVRYRIWHTKEHEFAYISQLELQSFLDRLLRRAELPMAFSQGFHPLPLISFGRALPVGVESLAEWFAVTLRRPMTSLQILASLKPKLVRGMRLLKADLIPVNLKVTGAITEQFTLDVADVAYADAMVGQWKTFASETTLTLRRETKNGPKSNDIRPIFSSIKTDKGQVSFTCDWSDVYISPLVLVKAVTPDIPGHLLRLVKTAQDV